MNRGNAAAHITKEHCSDSGHKSRARCCLGESHTMIAGVRSAQMRELAAALPVKLTAVYDNAADRRAVTADELCSGMDNDVCAVLERTEEVRRCECGVYNKRNLMCMCDFCDCLDIYDI